MNELLSNVVEWAYDHAQAVKGFTGGVAPLIVFVFCLSYLVWSATTFERFVFAVAVFSGAIVSIELSDFRFGPPPAV